VARVNGRQNASWIAFAIVDDLLDSAPDVAFTQGRSLEPTHRLFAAARLVHTTDDAGFEALLRHAPVPARVRQVMINRKSPRLSASRGTIDSRVASSVGVCDFCGRPRAWCERKRLVWDSCVDGDLVLAELCARCASHSKRLLEIYGGRGRDAVWLTPEPAVSSVARVRARRVGGVFLRGLVYVLMALASFVVVTLITSRW
jgi:hypothetical protein